MTEPIKVEYQYCYTADRKPRVTICYIRMPATAQMLDGWTAIGIAICAEPDNPFKKRGRGIAFHRALNACKEADHKSLRIRRPEALDTLVDVGLPNGFILRYKSSWESGTSFRWTSNHPRATE